MDAFHTAVIGEARYRITVDRPTEVTHDLVRTLLDIDLHTFAESTYSSYTAAAFLSHGAVFLMRAEGHIIGAAVCLRRWDAATEALLLSMAIQPGWRGQGLGQLFITEILARLAAEGVDAVSLMVGAQNRRALKVYGDVGFIEVERARLQGHSQEKTLTMRYEVPRGPPVVGGASE